MAEGGGETHRQDTRGCKALIAAAYRLTENWEQGAGNWGALALLGSSGMHPAGGHIACVGIKGALKVKEVAVASRLLQQQAKVE